MSTNDPAVLHKAWLKLKKARLQTLPPRELLAVHLQLLAMLAPFDWDVGAPFVLDVTDPQKAKIVKTYLGRYVVLEVDGEHYAAFFPFFPAELEALSAAIRVHGCPLPHVPAIVQEDPVLLDWCNGVLRPDGAGDFLKAVAAAALRTDPENYPLLRPFLLEMLKKYPQYLEAERARK